MEMRSISASFANGCISYPGRDEKAGNIQWNKHPNFKGVSLKHLIKGGDTGGNLSCHLVKIDPFCSLEEHMHENQWELHEVIEGEGSFALGTKEQPYLPGCVAIIPKSTVHRVIAGKDGMVLLAKFFPALI